MMRGSCKGALLAALASAGIAWGQSSSLPPRAPAPPAERVVTVQQKDSLPEQCQVLKTWTTKERHKAFLLRSLANDEMLTVVQTDGRPGDRQVGVRIYRWGNSKVPPEGTPAPPGDDGIRQAALAVEAAAPAPQPLPAVPPAAATAIDVGASCSGPDAVGCPSGSCGKGLAPCCYVHRYEQTPTIVFKAGACLPVCAPEGCPSYGYYPTQWRPWPGAVEPAPAVGHEMHPVPGESHELLPAPKASPALGRAPATGPALEP
jgi:hypothetical protein